MKLVPTSMPTDVSFWITIKQAAQFIIDAGKFIKELIFNPMTVLEKGIHGLQGTIEPTTLVILATIILLKMIGFKDIEKWGILSLIIYIVVIAL